MINSMTGYGSAELENDKFRIKVEIKSVNNRYCDIIIKAPRQFVSFEDCIKKAISSQISRGKVDVFITLDNLNTSYLMVDIDSSLAEDYYNKLLDLRQFLGLTSEVRLNDILKLEGIVKTTISDIKPEELKDLLNNTVKLAVDDLVLMRSQEGLHLRDELISRIGNVERILNVIKVNGEFASREYFEKLKNRIDELIKDDVCDKQRLEQEVAILADKSDITEEITRLDSHIEKYKAFLNESGPIGRKLDFLIQEFNREINTIGSKSSNDVIISCVIDFKSEVEKIREQVQNIE